MGGNVFKDTVPISHQQFSMIAEKLDTVINQTGAKLIPIGSTATPKNEKYSGDYDVLIDEIYLSNFFKEKNSRNIRKKLKTLFDQNGDTATLNGIAVHVRVPIDNVAVQADILVVPDAETISKFHIHQIPQGSPYKGVNKHLALNYLARKQNLLWSAFQGLFRRDADGKRAGFITNDIDRVAYILLGVNADSSSLDCIENMIQVMNPEDAEQMMIALKQDPSWKEFA